MTSTFQNRVFIWQWGRFGAGPRYAYELAQGLRSQGAHVLLSLSRQAEIMRTIPERDVDWPVTTYDNLSSLIVQSLFLGKRLRALEDFLRAHRPAAAICAMPGIWDAFVARRLRELHIPIITIVHDAQSHPGDFFGPVYQMQKLLIRRSASIITLSNFVASELIRKGLLHGRIHATIPHVPFLFPDLDLPTPRPPGYPERSVLRLLVAGRLQAYKGLELFFKAVKLLPKGVVKVRVAGRMDESIIRQIAAGVDVDLHAGWCPERELVTHIDWADAVMAPYMEASQSGIVTLALDRCRPVIATPVGGLPEQVKHERTGLITEEVSAEAIAAAIRRFLEDPQLFTHCRENVCKEARSESDWRHIAPRFQEIICRTISCSGRKDAERNWAADS